MTGGAENGLSLVRREPDETQPPRPCVSSNVTGGQRPLPMVPPEGERERETGQKEKLQVTALTRGVQGTKWSPFLSAVRANRPVISALIG